MQREIYKFITSVLESGLLIVTFKCDIYDVAHLMVQPCKLKKH